GLQEKIKLVAIDLTNKPDWYKKVYPPNKVPALEHNNEVIGESLDLIKYLDTNFEGPALLPQDPAKREFAEDLLTYTSDFTSGVIDSIKGDTDVGAPFDYLEAALSKFSDGPFFLGEFSLVDIAYAPHIERYQPLLLDLKKYNINITIGRPKLATWILKILHFNLEFGILTLFFFVNELNKIDGYTQTKRDPAELVASLKKRILLEIALHHVFHFNLHFSHMLKVICVLLQVPVDTVQYVYVFFFLQDSLMWGIPKNSKLYLSKTN
ncbi:hypothetical protein MKX01_013982, partial [Papaver californicum]